MIRAALAVLALCVAAPAAAEGDGAAGSLRGARPLPSLHLAPGDGAASLVIEPKAPDEARPPSCVAEFCPPRVDVPGMATTVPVRASKTELFVTILDRASIEPVASIAWFFVVTGLRADWSPANQDQGFGATAGGWGNLFVRLRLRIDAWNLPRIPERPRDRLRHDREVARERDVERERDAERMRAREIELRRATTQRPARLSST